MTLSLSKALRMVCYLLAAAGLFFMAVPFIDVALHQYDSPVAFVAGVFVGLFAAVFYFLSRCKTASQSSGRNPVIAGILWTATLIFGAVAVRLLYIGIRLYL